MEGEKQIPDRLYFRIGDVAQIVEVKPYVLRYWETEFSMIAPEKSSTGQRMYRRTDVETLLLIKHLLYVERYSIEGARKRIRELKKQGGLKEMLAQTSGAQASDVQASDAPVSDKESSSTAPVVESPNSPERKARLEEILNLARELRLLSQVSAESLFKS